MPSLSPKHLSASCSPVENRVETPPPVIKENEPEIIIIDPDVRSLMNDLLDKIDALKATSELRTNEPTPVNESRPVQLQFAERRSTVKQPRKSRLQQRIVTSQPPKAFPINPIPPPSSEQSISSTLPTVPLRPLSISPAKYIFLNL